MTMEIFTPCQTIARSMSVLFKCSEHGAHTRIRTPYLYPDGDCIDLFVKRATKGAGGTISDMGETIRWLRGQTLSPKRTARQTAMIDDITMTLGVEFFRGSLQARFDNEGDLTDAALRVAQAALRVSDLWLSFRNRGAQSVVAEVEEYLHLEKVPFEKSPRVLGKSGTSYSPDLRTRTEGQTSLVYVLSTGSRSAAKTVCERVLTAWYDLSYLQHGSEPTKFISLFDDTADVWAGEQFTLLESISTVARWSEPEHFGILLKAAA